MGKWGDILLLLVSAKGSKFMVILVFSLKKRKNNFTRKQRYRQWLFQRFQFLPNCFYTTTGGWRSLSSALYIPSTVLEDYTIHNLAYHYLLTIYTTYTSDIFHVTGIKYMPSSCYLIITQLLFNYLLKSVTVLTWLRQKIVFQFIVLCVYILLLCLINKNYFLPFHSKCLALCWFVATMAYKAFVTARYK